MKPLTLLNPLTFFQLQFEEMVGEMEIFWDKSVEISDCLWLVAFET